MADEMLRKMQEMEQGFEEMQLQMSALVVRSAAPRRLLLPKDEAASRAARAMDKRYINIVQSMGQSVHVLDCNYRVVYWGLNSTKLFGYTAREAIGESIIDLAIGEDDRAAARSIISKVYKGESWTGLFPCKNKWGESLLVVATNTPLYDDHGDLVGEVCLACDAHPFDEVLLPSVNQQPEVESRFSKLRNKTASKLGIDAQQPLQAAVTSRVSNLVSRFSSKVSKKIRSFGTKGLNQERCLDNDISQSSHHILTTPLNVEDTKLDRVGTFITASSSYGEFSESRHSLFCDFYNDIEVASDSQKGVSMETEMSQGKAPWRKDSDFGVYRSDVGKRQAAIYKETSSSCSSVFSISSKTNTYSSGCTSNSGNCGSTSNSYVSRVDKDPDFADCEILWEHLAVREQIGQGSCGTVYRAQWCGSDVAVKVFSNQEFSDDLICTFRKELSLMKKLRHPNILLFMGAVTVGGHLCIVTEFLPRGSLFQLLRKKTVNINWRRRVNMAVDIAQGMNYLHRSNPPVVHRDLKSSNLLVDKNWNVKVGDFGLSRVKLETFLMTKTGKGTPQWMAPESLRHEPSDEKSDIYSYGVILWELATREVPWGDLNPMQVIGVVGFKNQRLAIPDGIDPQWALLIESCWHSDPRSRPTFLEIIQRLKSLQRQFASV